MSGVLEGVKVVEVTIAIAMPTAAAILGDWGADIIKIEAPAARDAQRRSGGAPAPQRGAFYGVGELANRNKRALIVDLKKERGTEILNKLVQGADVFVSNFPVRTLRGLKADYETLSQVNPKIIHCINSAYGRFGPDKDERGGDYTAGWARSGAQYQVAEPGTPPAMNLYGFGDRITAGHAVAGILGALYHREKTGEGQELELSIYHTAVWCLAHDVQSALMGAPPPKFEHSTGVTNNPLWNYYEAKDGRGFQFQFVDWPELCRAIERPDLENDPRFSTPQARTEHCKELISIFDEIFATKTREEWEKRFRANDVVYGLVQTPMEVTKDPQAIAENFFVDVDNTTNGKIKLVTQPIDFHQNPSRVRGPAPKRGQHTEEVLLEIGYSLEDIGQLKEQGVIL